MTKIAERYASRTAFLNGYAHQLLEAGPGGPKPGWWGSPLLTLPEGVDERIVRLQAEDGGESRGYLYRRGGERTVIVFNHPRGDFSTHYLNPALLSAGYAVFGGQVRSFANDSDCVHECLLADIAGQIRYLRAIGFEKIVLCGNSGGGSLSAFYQAQAATPPPGRLTDTAAGDSYDLNAFEMAPADGVMLLAAHVGEGEWLLDNLDPSVTDETDPLSCDPSLDMFNPDNGYRRPPETSSYAPAFIERYRAAQVERCRRIDAVARQAIERRRHYGRQLQGPGFESLLFKEQLHLIRMATASQYITIPRTQANPSYADLSINPNKRQIGTLVAADPHVANYKLDTFASVMTPEGWLSTWSGLSSRASLPENVKRFDHPLLVMNYDADNAILPHEAARIFGNAISPDKVLIDVDANHYGAPVHGPSDAAIREIGVRVVEWLAARF